MISKIKMRNLQIHRSLDLDLDPGVNVIHAPTDSGKTSILRGFTWVKDNRGSWTALRHDPRKSGDGNRPIAKSEVTQYSLCFEEDEVSRARDELSNGQNGYLIQVNGKSEFLSALNRDVPEKVSKLINISQYSVQNQHDPLFLLTDSPGEVARKINELTNLDSIDIVRKRCDGIISEAKSKLEETSKELESVREEICQLQFIDNTDNELKELEKWEVEYSTLLDDIAFLEDYISYIEDIEGLIKSSKDDLKIEKQLKDLSKSIQEYLDYKEDYDNLHKEAEIAGLRECNVYAIQDSILEWEKLKPVYEMIKEYDLTLSRLDSLDLIIEDILYIIEALDNHTKERDANIKEYIKLFEQNPICPMCGNKADLSTIKSILFI